MNDLLVWTKTVLTAYPCLPKFARVIEQCTMTTAMSGFSYTGDPMQLMEQMRIWNIRKEGIVNLKVIVDQAMNKLPLRQREVLEWKYMQKMRFAAIAEKAQVCMRTVFRRYAQALDAFGRALERLGYGAEELTRRYQDEPFILKIRERVAERMLQPDPEDRQSDVALDKAVPTSADSPNAAERLAQACRELQANKKAHDCAPELSGKGIIDSGCCRTNRLCVCGRSV